MAQTVTPIATPAFHAIPSPNSQTPAHHAITTHMPGWDMMLEFTKKKPEFFAKFVDMYPRFILHRDVKKVNVDVPFFIAFWQRRGRGGGFKESKSVEIKSLEVFVFWICLCCSELVVLWNFRSLKVKRDMECNMKMNSC
jgi:hypothetical protein